MMIVECLELCRQDLLSHLLTVVDVVGAVGNDLGLNDWAQPLALADRGIASQRVNCLLDGEITRKSFRRVQLQDIAPLGETRTLRVSLGRSLLQIIETLARGFWVA